MLKGTFVFSNDVPSGSVAFKLSNVVVSNAQDKSLLISMVNGAIVFKLVISYLLNAYYLR